LGVLFFLKLVDTQRMTFYLLIIVAAGLLSLLLKQFVLYQHTREPKIHLENSIEKSLNEQMADQKFEATYQHVNVRRARSRSNPEWRTPAEMLLEDELKRSHDDWSPEVPGVVHTDPE